MHLYYMTEWLASRHLALFTGRATGALCVQTFVWHRTANPVVAVSVYNKEQRAVAGKCY